MHKRRQALAGHYSESGRRVDEANHYDTDVLPRRLNYALVANVQVTVLLQYYDWNREKRSYSHIVAHDGKESWDYK